MIRQIKMYPIVAFGLFSMFVSSCSKDLKGDQNIIPTITSDSVVAIEFPTHPNAIVKAQITVAGSGKITESGVCFDTVPNPTIASIKTKTDNAATGSFSVRLSSLSPNTKYYAKAYATNSAGTGYSNEVTFFIQPVKIGDEFKGGIIFYVDASGKHGLISAKRGNDLSGSWGCPVDVPGTKTEIGTGQANTAAIIALCGDSSAAKKCDNLVELGYSDWFLPSRDELFEMYKYRSLLDFNTVTRWSSSQIDVNSAWTLSFDTVTTNTPVSANKSVVNGIRPIRAF